MDTVTWRLFDLLGTLAFAVSGAMVGIKTRMDIFGIVVLAELTAIGGGVIRDVLADITPPTALCNIQNFMLALVTALVLSLLYSLRPIPRQSRHLVMAAYNITDTLGLAAFTVTGMLTGLRSEAGDPYVFPILLGVITAVGGGVLRDLLAQRMPAVLYKDVYATASLVGALAGCLALPFFGKMGMVWLTFAVVVLLRFCALRFGWNLLRPRLNAWRRWRRSRSREER